MWIVFIIQPASSSVRSVQRWRQGRSDGEPLDYFFPVHGEDQVSSRIHKRSPRTLISASGHWYPIVPTVAGPTASWVCTKAWRPSCCRRCWRPPSCLSFTKRSQLLLSKWWVWTKSWSTEHRTALVPSLTESLIGACYWFMIVSTLRALWSKPVCSSEVLPVSPGWFLFFFPQRSIWASALTTFVYADTFSPPPTFVINTACLVWHWLEVQSFLICTWQEKQVWRPEIVFCC